MPPFDSSHGSPRHPGATISSDAGIRMRFVGRMGMFVLLVGRWACIRTENLVYCSDIHSGNPRFPIVLDTFWKPPNTPIKGCQAPIILQPLNTLSDAVAASQAPHRPADTMLLGVILETTLQGDVVHRRLLVMAEFGQHDWRDPLRGWAVICDIASRRRVYTKGVEAIAVQACFDDGTRACVNVLAGRVQM